MPLRIHTFRLVAAISFILTGSAFATDLVKDCFPDTSDYETGSVNSTTRTQYSLVEAAGNSPLLERGYMVFNTGVIPDGSTINSVRLNVFRYSNNQPDWYITRLSADPRIGMAGEAFADIAYADTDGFYVHTTEATQPPGWYYYDLPPQAATDLQSRLGSDWFGVGTHEATPTGLNFIMFQGWYEPGIPYISVNYTPPAGGADPILAVSGRVDPGPADDWIAAGTTSVQVLWSRPPGVEVESVVFLYSTDSLLWVPFWTDRYGGEPSASSFWPIEDSGDGWTGYFDSDLLVPPPAQTTPLLFRADIHTNGGFFTGFERSTYDPTPPYFSLNVEDDQFFTDPTVTVTVTPEHEGDAANFSFNDVDTSGVDDKKVPRICQFKPQFPRAGSTYCGPTAAAACLRYFDTHGGNPNMVPPGVDDDSLVEELAGRMDVDRDGKGATESRVRNGITNYLNDHGQADGYDVRGETNTHQNAAKHWKIMRRAIELCHDVLPLINYPPSQLHWVTATGVRVCDGKI